LTVIRKRSEVPTAGELPVTIDERSFEQSDALRDEIRSFLDCIRTGRAPLVGGEDGLRALETAIRINRALLP
jgi:predicted dehydrogenase